MWDNSLLKYQTVEKLSGDSTINFELFLIEMKIKNPNIGTIFKHFIIQLMHHCIIRRYNYEAYSESKYCFTVRIKFYCYQILHSSNYFSIYSPPLLKNVS